MDPQQLDQKQKLVMYTKAFIEIYNWQNGGLVHEIHGMVKHEKYLISRKKNLLNLRSQQILQNIRDFTKCPRCAKIY